MKLLQISAALATYAVAMPFNQTSLNPALQPLRECDGATYPDYDVCDSIVAASGWEGNHDRLTPCLVSDGSGCYTATQAGDSPGNCVISVCFTHPDDCSTGLTYDDIWQRYLLIESGCKSQNAGGLVNDSVDETASNWVVAAKNNLDATSKVSYSDSVDSVIVTRGVKPMKRDNNKFVVLTQSSSVPKPGVTYLVSDKLSAGSSETWTTTNEMSVSVAATAGVSASVFEIFTATFSLTVTYETSYSIAESIGYTVGKCTSEFAQVYWDPLFDSVEGFVQDLDTGATQPQETVWNPRELNGKAEGEFRTVCLG